MINNPENKIPGGVNQWKEKIKEACFTVPTRAVLFWTGDMLLYNQMFNRQTMACVTLIRRKKLLKTFFIFRDG